MDLAVLLSKSTEETIAMLDDHGVTAKKSDWDKGAFVLVNREDGSEAVVDSPMEMTTFLLGMIWGKKRAVALV